MVGLIFPHTPTASLSLNLGLSILTIGFVQWEGIKANGFFGHLKHFAGPKLPGILAAVSVIIFGIEIVSETMKMLSLSLRLFANISGGHTVKSGLDSIAPGVPVSALILPIEFLAAVIQALVWSLLTCVYLSLVTSHEHGEEAHEEHPGVGPHGGEEISRKDTGLTPADTGLTHA